MTKLLDHGYLELVETWGSDQSIIEAARMSTDKGFLGWGPKHEKCKNCDIPRDLAKGIDCRGVLVEGTHPTLHEWVGEPGDEKLLRYLWEHEHATPFEMAGLTIEVKAPIMVFREWHRHRVPFGYNEMSARYVPLPDENYVPDVGDLVERSEKAATTANRQASGTGKVLSLHNAYKWQNELIAAYAHIQGVYEDGLALGVPKELARLPIPVGRYSRMRATANLRGWLGFMKLRAAPGAQKEIRVYAEALGEIIREKFPRTWALYAEGK